MEAPIAPRDRLARAMLVDLPDNEPYVMLPEPLALDLRESKLAVGIYMLIARNYLVHQKHIPLSTADIDAYDGSGTLSRGVIVHALNRLCAEGWLIAQRQQGKKTAYYPAWGIVGDAPRPWDLTVAGLDRPRTVRAIRVPRIVIDVCLGRLTPHHRHTALIERYVTRPVLSLRDVGAYGLLWAGILKVTPALLQLGLANSDGPLPPPSWNALLARISQRPLFDADPEAPTLSVRGLQHVGLISSPATPAPEETPLFFVPPNMIEHLTHHMIPNMTSNMIPDMINSEAPHNPAPSAAERAETPIVCASQATTANLGNEANEANKATPPPQPDPLPTQERRRSDPSATTAAQRSQQATLTSQSDTPKNVPPPLPAEPLTEAEQMLRALEVYPNVAHQFRDFPLALIERAEIIAERLPMRKSKAGSIVYFLRQEQAMPGWLRQERPDLFLSAMLDDSTEDASIVEETESAAGDDSDPREHIHALLSAAIERKIFFSIDHIVLDTETIAVDLPDHVSSEGRASMDAALRTVAAQIGLRPIVSAGWAEAPPAPPAPLLLAPAAAPTTPAESERPAWISAEQWSQLHVMARTALAGSRIEGGEVVGSSPGITRTLHTLLAGLVKNLLESAGSPGGTADDPQSGSDPTIRRAIHACVQ